MPASSGASHGIAAFLSLVVGAILSKYVWQLLPSVGEASLLAITLVRSTTGAEIPLNEQMAGMVIVMIALSFVWGVVYHIGRHA
jgi:hypothetical protein